jgi:hypothetical protein
MTNRCNEFHVDERRSDGTLEMPAERFVSRVDSLETVFRIASLAFIVGEAIGVPSLRGGTVGLV